MTENQKWGGHGVRVALHLPLYLPLLSVTD